MKPSATERPQAEAPRKIWICPIIEVIDRDSIMGGPRTSGEGSSSLGVHGGNVS